MSTLKTNDINHLVGEFMSLYELWEEDPARFDWTSLTALAREGAQAYNEGLGPSFQILTFDGYPHGEFHERFLGDLLAAGFDPFKTVRSASGASAMAVFGHDGLADAAHTNPASARMLAVLHEIARRRFTGAETTATSEELQRIVQLCSDAIPHDVLEKIAPEFA
jgi:hypothetical protein